MYKSGFITALVLPDQPLHGFDAHFNGTGRILRHRHVEPRFFPFLIPHHMEAASAPDAQGSGHYKESRGLHLTCFYTQTLPALPFLQQLIIHGRFFRAVLSVERILALDNTSMDPVA